jgi:hypothetical protein
MLLDLLVAGNAHFDKRAQLRGPHAAALDESPDGFQAAPPVRAAQRLIVGTTLPTCARRKSPEWRASFEGGLKINWPAKEPIMNLHVRTMLLVTALLVVAVSATAAVLTWTSRLSLLAQTQADGELIARLLARSASFAEYVPHEVERAIGDQMVVEATIAAHLVAIAEEAGLSPAAINAHLQEIANGTVLDEFWITDETGHAVFRSDIGTDFTFSPDVQQQPQACEFWPLLTGERDVVVQDARLRELDNEVFKYVGVSGFDQPRIVQVGYQAAFLHNLAQQVGLMRLVAELVVKENVSAIQVVDSDLLTLAYSAVPDGMWSKPSPTRMTPIWRW